MAEPKFTQAHVDALNKLIAEKKANPAMEILGDIAHAVVNAAGDAAHAAVVGAAGAAGAAAVTAVVGADAKPADVLALKGKIPEGGFSLDQLIKAREHALKNI